MRLDRKWSPPPSEVFRRFMKSGMVHVSVPNATTRWPISENNGWGFVYSGKWQVVPSIGQICNSGLWQCFSSIFDDYGIFTIFVTWQLRVTLVSIHNYCDVFRTFSRLIFLWRQARTAGTFRNARICKHVRMGRIGSLDRIGQNWKD